MHMSAHASTHMSIHPSTHTSIHVSTHLSMHMSIHMSMHMSRHMSTHIATHMSIRDRAEECVCDVYRAAAVHHADNETAWYRDYDSASDRYVRRRTDVVAERSLFLPRRELSSAG